MGAVLAGISTRVVCWARLTAWKLSNNWRYSRASRHLMWGQVAMQIWGRVKRLHHPRFWNKCMSLSLLQLSG